MAFNDLQVDVRFVMTPDKETAERALQIVEWYCNDRGVHIETFTTKDGTKYLRFEGGRDHADSKPHGGAV